MPLDEHRITNRANWDSRVELHYGSDQYGVDRFISDRSHLSGVVRYDRDKLGDVSGKRLLHLQCHIGTDLLGPSRRNGHRRRSLREVHRGCSTIECGVTARFVVSELYDTPNVIDEKFDIVYTGVGAICWLPHIRDWAAVMASFLPPGGLFYMREGHPMMWALDWEDPERLSVIYPYFETAEPSADEGEVTYAGEGRVTSPLNYQWNHGMGETINALIQAGLRIDRVEEYDECEWQGLDQMVLEEDGLWRLAEGRERLPLMWSVLATKF